MNDLSNYDVKLLRDRLEEWQEFYEDPTDADKFSMFANAISVINELLAFREAAEKPVAFIADCGTIIGEGDPFFDDYKNPEPLFTAPPLPVVSAELALVPRKLTAENGAKGALLGEFLETKYISCPECFGDDDCESCDGSGRIKVDVTVSWDTIKRIYSSAIDLFCKEDDMLAAAPKPGVESE